MERNDEISFYVEDVDYTPKKQTEEAVGYDLHATKVLKVYKGSVEVTGEKLEKVKESFEKRGSIKLRPHERMLFGTGVHPDLPNHLELQVRSRSGLALKTGLLVANSPGTIDPDYKGEIGVIILNSTPFLNEVKRYERIAQVVPKKIDKVEVYYFPIKHKPTSTEGRGDKGFGSTGK